MKVVISDKEYEIKYSLRAQFVYEQIAGVPFSPAKMLNVYLLIYCCLLCFNDTFRITFDQFIDRLDQDPALNRNLIQWITMEANLLSNLTGDKNDNNGNEEIDEKKN